MPDDTRAHVADETGSGILDEVTLRALIEHVPVTVYIAQEWASDKDLYAKVLHPEDREQILAEYRRTRDTDEPFRAEYRMIARDGSVHWFLDEAAVIRDEAGRPAYFHGFLLDITERKRVEEALHSSEQELRRQKQYVETLVE